MSAIPRARLILTTRRITTCTRDNECVHGSRLTRHTVVQRPTPLACLAASPRHTHTAIPAVIAVTQQHWPLEGPITVVAITLRCPLVLFR